MNQKLYPIVRDASKISHPHPESMVKYKTSYKGLKGNTIFGPSFCPIIFLTQSQKTKNIAASSGLGSLGPELTDMLASLKDKMINFCGKHENIHSSWIKIDGNKKEVAVYIVLNELDFDLEFKIFQEVYIDLPVIFEDYYINPMVSILNGAEIETKVPTGSIQIYPG
jgi:hypothetical protein